MSYHYEDDSYECSNNGNCGDESNDYNYESYLDYAEPNHCEPELEPPPFELDYDDTGHNNYSDCEKDTNCTSWEVEEEPQRFESEGEVLYEWERLEYRGDEIYKHEGLEQWSDREYPPGEPNDKIKGDVYYPVGSEYEDTNVYEHGTLKYEGTMTPRHNEEAGELSELAHTSTYLTSMYVHPNTPFSTPTHIPHACDTILRLNQHGHMTALQSCESLFDNVYNDDECIIENPNTNYFTPTHTLHCTPKPKPNADELVELAELEQMFEKWGYEPQRLGDGINVVYNLSRLTNDNSTIQIPPRTSRHHLHLLPTTISRPSAMIVKMGFQMPSHTCRIFRTLLGTANISRRNGKQIDGWKYRVTTTYCTPNTITSLIQGLGMPSMNLETAYLTSLRDCAPYIQH